LADQGGGGQEEAAQQGGGGQEEATQQGGGGQEEAVQQGDGSQEELAELGKAFEERLGFSPQTEGYHPSFVRYNLALGVLVFVGLVVLSQVIYSMVSTAGCPLAAASGGGEAVGRSLQQVLDDFALFDAPLFTLAGVVFTFYFTGTHE
jgi:hypothetical protein